ncbi:MAG: hypothetical protein SNJ59_04830 [Aggregatilineales bacterium]
MITYSTLPSRSLNAMRWHREARRQPRELFAFCPSCGQHGWFAFQGVQHWSEGVIAQAGIPQSTTLWTCEHCLSTLSEPALKR